MEKKRARNKTPKLPLFSKFRMSAISSDQIQQITTMVRKQLGSDPGGIMRDERVWTLVIHLQNYAVSTLADLEGMATTERKWKRGCEDICRWDNTVLDEEVVRLKSEDPSIEKRYHFAVVRYVKHLYRNVRSHRMKLSVLPFKDFLRTFLQVLISRTDVKNRNLLDFGPSDQQHAILDGFRITMDRLYNKAAGDADDNYVYVGAESIVGGGSIAPSESVSCVAARQYPEARPPRPAVPSFLSKERLEHHKSQVPTGSQVSRRSVQSKRRPSSEAAAPPEVVAPSHPPESVVRSTADKSAVHSTADKSAVRSTAIFRQMHNQPSGPAAAQVNDPEASTQLPEATHTEVRTQVSRTSRKGARTEISPSRTNERSVVERSQAASVREVDLSGGGTTQVSQRSGASRFRRPPRSSRHSSSRTTISARSVAPRPSASSTVSSAQKKKKNKQGCFFDLNSRISDDVRSHVL